MKIRCVLLLLFAPLLMAESDGSPFRQSDRWTAVGDSITQNGSYHTWIEVFYATRFPMREISLSNSGISGDTAEGAVKRFEWDIAPTRPTIATVMFGMNDVGRDLYNGGASDQTRKERRNRIAGYAANLEELVRRLELLHCRIQLITPTPFDEGAQIAEPNLPGVNAALVECAQIVRRIAANHRTELLELQVPMMAWTAAGQVNEPSFTFTTGDRVHPIPPHHIAIAYWLLRAQGVPNGVSDIEIDSVKGTVTKEENARVSNLVKGDSSVTFTAEADALPWPIEGNLARIAFARDLNRETLCVTGLPSGTYELSIDGGIVGPWSDVDFSHGVALGDKIDTPQYRQAVQVRQAIEHQADLMRQLRVVAQVNHSIDVDPRQPTELGILRQKVERWRDEAKGGPREDYRRSLARRYLETQPRVSTVQAEIDDLARSIRALARPVPRHYQIVRSRPRTIP